jgi:hypothetical protein
VHLDSRILLLDGERRRKYSVKERDERCTRRRDDLASVQILPEFRHFCRGRVPRLEIRLPRFCSAGQPNRATFMHAGCEEQGYPRVLALEIRGKTLRVRKESYPDLSFRRATSRQQITAKPSIYARDTPPNAGVLGTALGALRTGTLPGRTGENRLTLF